VAIVPPDERWSRLFAAERRRLESLRTLIDIEHFGSTAVPGLAAKPVIDIMASVAQLATLDQVEQDLASLGYRLLDVGFAKRRFYRNQDVAPGITANLHVVTVDRWRDKGERVFRDWLIKHPETAHRYALLKRNLATRFPEDPEAYTAAKTEFIREVVNLARQDRGLPPEIDWSE
jgi:GrpB-like predicted nucleotidyltransferase (UPF0157 family)